MIMNIDTLPYALSIIKELQDQLDQATAELNNRNGLIESQRRTIEIQRKEMEKLLERYVLRKKAEMPNIDQPIFAELAEYFDNLLKESEAVLADEESETEESESPKKKKSYKKKHPGRQILPAHLERQTTVVDISEDEKIDPITNQPLVEIRREVTEKLDVIAARLIVNRTERPVYGLPGGKGIEVAPLPEHVLGKTMVDTGFLADMEVKRFVDHIPFDRQSKALQREGINFHRNDLDGWHLKVSEAVLPIYEAIVEAVLKTDYIAFDNTPVKLRMKDVSGNMHTSRIWICRAGTGPPLVFFRFTRTKEKENATALVGNFRGFAQADAEPIHNQVMLKEGITEVGCWAHVIRNLKDALAAHPIKARDPLKLLGQLYDVEEEAQDMTPEERLDLRQKKSKPIMDKFYVTLEKIDVLPKSPLGAVIAYCINQKVPLQRYLEDGRLSIDNNAVERGLRPWGRGRVNWLFFGSERGGRAAATMMTLVASCRNIQINPWIYLKDVLDRIPTHPADRMHDLIPGVWEPLEKNAKLNVPIFINPGETFFRPL